MATPRALIADSGGDPGCTVVTSYGAGSLTYLVDPNVHADDPSGTGLAIAPADLVAGVPNLAYTNRANIFTVAPQTIVIDADAHAGVVVKAHSGTQSANLQEWQTSGGTAQSYIDAGGHILSKVHAAVGNKAQIDTPYDLSDWSSNPLVAFFVQEEYTTFPATSEVDGIGSYVVANPSADIACSVHGIECQVDFGLSPSNPDFAGVNPHSTTYAVTGLDFGVNHWGSGNINNAYGCRGLVQNNVTGTITNAYGLFAAAYQNTAHGGMTYAYGLNIDATYAPTGSVVSNAYGAYITDQSPAGGSPGVVNHWNIYSQGATTRNTFEGSVLVGASGVGNAAAVLQADSTTQGFLPPRMTTTQRNAIASPPQGLIIYNSTTHKLAYYNGTIWTEL